MNRRTLVFGFPPALASRAFADPARERRPRIAAVATEYRDNSHADVILTKLLEGAKLPDGEYRPRVDVASLYLDQTPSNDIGRQMAAKHHVPIYAAIEKALTLGGNMLAVDGVVLIGEHGRYSYNEFDQHMYPRRRFFDEAVAVMRRSGRVVPVFNDKHLSYNWADARAMYDTARELKIPFMAGSSLPLTWRRPALELPPGAELTELLAVGFGGTEAYGFHALETLQCMAERRKGGETGVKSVQCLSGDAVWKAGEAGRWSWKMLRAALSRSERPAVGAASDAQIRERAADPDAFLIEYADGTRGTVLMLYGLVEEFLFAGSIAGKVEPVSTLFWLQEGKPFAHFALLCRAMERMFLTGKPTYPVERTLLTTGILDAIMHSRFDQGRVRRTPELTISYKP